MLNITIEWINLTFVQLNSFLHILNILLIIILLFLVAQEYSDKVAGLFIINSRRYNSILTVLTSLRSLSQDYLQSVVQLRADTTTQASFIHWVTFYQIKRYFQRPRWYTFQMIKYSLKIKLSYLLKDYEKNYIKGYWNWNGRF